MASHVYNAWLVELVKSGQVQGLEIEPLWTNVLFDHLLSILTVAFGMPLGEKLAVSICVLVFFWGSFVFLSAISDRPAWWSTPILGMLAYGVVFHFGFFNFYISVGLSLGALGVIWRRPGQLRIFAAFLLVLAAYAHVLPVGWALATMAYLEVEKYGSRARTWGLFGLALLATVISTQIVPNLFAGTWRSNTGALGFDQVLVFGQMKYLAILVPLLVLWLLAAFLTDDGSVWRRPLSRVWMLNAVGIYLAPFSFSVGTSGAPFAVIAERMSLIQALVGLAMVTGERATRTILIVSVVLAGCFFSMLYGDHAALNSIEDEVETVVRDLPPHLRYVSMLSSHVAVLHHIDRACVGHCYSYSNYEPSSNRFRLRALPGNDIVASDYDEVHRILYEEYTVPEKRFPLFAVEFCGEMDRKICVRPLRPGEKLKNKYAFVW